MRKEEELTEEADRFDMLHLVQIWTDLLSPLSSCPFPFLSPQTLNPGLSQSNLNSNQDSAVYRVCSNLELWLYSFFNFLPLDSIKTVGLHNRFFHSSVRTITHPALLGLFPVDIWSNHILPLLTYRQLKKFQKVSQVAKSLTLSKYLSEIMFRDDVDPRKGSRFHDYKGYSNGHKSHFSNPLSSSIGYYSGDSLDQIYVLHKGNEEKAKLPRPGSEERALYSETKEELAKNDGMDNYQAFNENTTSPPAPKLILRKELDSGTFYHTIKETGRPLWGGELHSVTCKGVMKALDAPPTFPRGE